MFSGSLEYMVKPGDSLSLIARKYQRPATDWKKIFDLNADQIKNPDIIQPGQILKIPINWDDQTTPPPPAAKQAWSTTDLLIWGSVAAMAWYLLRKKKS